MKKVIFSTYDKRATTGLNTYSKEFKSITAAKKFADKKQNIFGMTIIDNGIARNYYKGANWEMI